MRNINWNEYVILFLARHKFISLLDFVYDTEKSYRIKIRIENLDILEQEAFLSWVTANREEERKWLSMDWMK